MLKHGGIYVYTAIERLFGNQEAVLELVQLEGGELALA
jgi:hypothetical protein